MSNVFKEVCDLLDIKVKKFKGTQEELNEVLDQLEQLSDDEFNEVSEELADWYDTNISVDTDVEEITQLPGFKAGKAEKEEEEKPKRGRRRPKKEEEEVEEESEEEEPEDEDSEEEEPEEEDSGFDVDDFISSVSDGDSVNITTDAGDFEGDVDKVTKASIFVNTKDGKKRINFNNITNAKLSTAIQNDDSEDEPEEVESEEVPEESPKAKVKTKAKSSSDDMDTLLDNYLEAKKAFYKAVISKIN